MASPDDLREHRRRKRNAKTYRCQKRRRKRRKGELVAAAGGCCVDCGYSTCLAALEFHHRDAAGKDFGVGNFDGSLARLLAEVQKCDLLCANCHRLRHAVLDDDALLSDLGVARREQKRSSVMHMGSSCFECERTGVPALFEFHHVDARDKDFGISRSGIVRAWDEIVTELEKCIMLCANCHREVHAGVRTIRPTLLGLAEDELPYVA